MSGNRSIEESVPDQLSDSHPAPDVNRDTPEERQEEGEELLQPSHLEEQLKLH